LRNGDGDVSTAAAKLKKEKKKKEEDRTANCASVERAARSEIIGGVRLAGGGARQVASRIEHSAAVLQGLCIYTFCTLCPHLRSPAAPRRHRASLAARSFDADASLAAPSSSAAAAVAASSAAIFSVTAAL